MALQWEPGLGDQALGCEEIDQQRACKDRIGKVSVEELAPPVGKARNSLEQAQKAGWCRNTQMVRDRGFGFIQGMDGFRAETEAGSEQR
jgi:hypothetical protein